MFTTEGWNDYCIWEHSTIVKQLYRQRCRKEVEEMTCAVQAVELLRPGIEPGDTILDIGCGSGYFFHSLNDRRIAVDYWGIDAAPSLIAIGKQEMPAFGLAADRLQTCRIDDLGGHVDHVVCMNVLSNIDNYHRPLERLLKMANKSVILRESVSPQLPSNGSSYTYVTDHYLDDDVDLKVYVNTYEQSAFESFIAGYGFDVSAIRDERTGGEPELIIDHEHRWQFFRALRRT